MPELAPVTTAVMFSRDLDIIEISLETAGSAGIPLRKRSLPVSISLVQRHALSGMFRNLMENRPSV